MNTIKISLVEDENLFRDGLKALLNEVEDFEVQMAVENGKVFLDLLSRAEVLPDVILADFNMREMNGLELTEIIQKKYPSIKIIILSIYDQDRFVWRMIEAGVAGYLAKNCDTGEVELAIRMAHKTGFYFSENTQRAMRNGYKFRNTHMRTLLNIPAELTERELEIMKLICMEFTNMAIAEKLNISVRTVDGHRNNLLAKTGCKNTAGLVLFAIRNNIFDPVLLS